MAAIEYPGPFMGFMRQEEISFDDDLTLSSLHSLFDQAEHSVGCNICNEAYSRCPHFPTLPTWDTPFSLLPEPTSSAPRSRPRSSTLSSHTVGPSNESGPLPRSQQEMESSGAGALAMQAAPLPDNPYTPRNRVMTLPDLDVDFAFDDGTFLPDLAERQPAGASFDTPNHVPPVNHFDASNVRESAEQRQELEEQQQEASPTSTNAAFAAATLANFNVEPSNLSFEGAGNLDRPPTTQSLPYAGAVFEDGPEYFDEEDLQNMKAFAKLSFDDGDYFVTSLRVIVGRDVNYHRELRLEAMRDRKRQVAQAELAGYKQEPSAPSQPGDGDNAQDPSSKSSQSLEGRPAKALPSNYSEQGGAVAYTAQSDDESQGRRAKRKSKRKRYKGYENPQSSSTTSIAPANLHLATMGDFSHPNPYAADAGAHNDDPHFSLVPIHPTDPEEIKLISKHHILVRYDFEAECWMLEVLGSWVTVNDTQLKRYDMVRLNHLDRIQIFSVELTFKLPIDDSRELSPGLSHGRFADEGDDEDEQGIASSLQQLSDAEEDGEVEVQEADGATKKRKGPTIKLGKKKAQEKQMPDKEIEKPAKARKKKEGSPEQSPEATKKPDKGKKPKAAAKEPEEAAATGEAKDEKAEKAASPPVPINIQPGSVLAGLAPDQLPQKRKGPGRPPKNGLISKRDEAFIKRKQKDLEKQGLPIPTMDELLAIVRAENKQREAMQKAIANGQQPPADMAGVVQSIEMDPALQSSSRSAAGVDAAGMALLAGADSEDKFTSATPGEALRRASSPKPKRVAKSPSPIPPESDYTEEQLRKPNQTYVHILDEILREIGKGDLQEIYDKIIKKYPFYKYRVNTPGWQSSVRHNLLQNPRFKEDGRSGKGKLWAINFDVPIEREKKRRITPPSRPPMPMQQMQNGQWPPHGMPYGQPAYGAYGQPGVPPQQFPAGQHAPNGAYASPYAQHQGYGPPPPGQPGMQHPHQPYPPGAGSSQTPHRQQGSATPAPRSQFQGIVDEIMDYRTRYLRPFPPNSAEFQAKSELFSKCTNFVSNRFHGVGGGEGQDEIQGEEEKQVCDALDGIMARWEHLKETAAAGPSQQGTPAADGAGGGGGNGGPAAVAGTIDSPAIQSTNVAAVQGPTSPIGLQTGVQAPVPDAAADNGQQAPAPAQVPTTGEPQMQDSHPQMLESVALSATVPSTSEQPTASAPLAEAPAPPQVNGTKRAAEDDAGDGNDQQMKRSKTDDD